MDKSSKLPFDWKGISTPTESYWIGLNIIEREMNADSPDNLESCDPFGEYVFWCKLSVIWVCCTIESFINEEGVSWTGERFFMDNVEKSRPEQKIQIVYALKYGHVLNSKSDILRQIRDLFDMRNQLMHPKTREVKESRAQGIDLFTKLINTKPKQLRQLFLSLTRLFEPKGIGEK